MATGRRLKWTIRYIALWFLGITVDMPVFLYKVSHNIMSVEMNLSLKLLRHLGLELLHSQISVSHRPPICPVGWYNTWMTKLETETQSHSKLPLSANSPCQLKATVSTWWTPQRSINTHNPRAQTVTFLSWLLPTDSTYSWTECVYRD